MVLFWGSSLLFVFRVWLSYCLVCSLQPCNLPVEKVTVWKQGLNEYVGVVEMPSECCFRVAIQSASFSNWVSCVFHMRVGSQICLFVCFPSLRPINNLSVINGRVFLGWTSTKLGLMCLAQWHNAVTPMRLELAAPWSRVKYSTTEPLRSHRQSEVLK